MGSQPLSARRTRYYERLIGLSLDRVLSHGGNDHWLSFRTPDHRHGAFKIRKVAEAYTEVELSWSPEEGGLHWVTCKEQFPLDFEPNPPYRFIGRHY